jgi:dienelactone hydrolase
VVAILAGCSSSPSASPSVSASSQEPSAAMSTEPSTSPAADPSIFAFAGAPPEVTIAGSETAAGATTTDLLFEAEGVEPTEAYLVTPEAGTDAAATPGPGIIWFHWVEYGAPTSNRTEFLPEAQALAAQGVTSLLVQGTMPWLTQPESIDHDVPAVQADVRMLRSGLDLLAGRSEVDPDRLAAVGHDFGGMYSSVVFGADDRLKALVVMAPTARWADWFYRYWEISDDEADYTAALAPMDPVTWLPLAGPRPVLLQFAGNDQYVPADVAAEISAAAGDSARTETYPDASHELNEAAQADRDSFLAEQLGFPSPN